MTSRRASPVDSRKNSLTSTTSSENEPPFFYVGSHATLSPLDRYRLPMTTASECCFINSADKPTCGCSSNNGDIQPDPVSQVVFFERKTPLARIPVLFADSSATPSTTTTTTVTAPLSLKERLLQLSNWATILCILDCTVLPFLLLVLSLFGLVSGGTSTVVADWLHHFGHQIALYFVLPVGSLAVLSNWVLKHKRLWIALMGALGLCCIALSNGAFGHGHVHGAATTVVHSPHQWEALSRVLSVAQYGVTHRMVNLLGCAFLMGSNYLSHRLGGSCSDKSCKAPHCAKS